MSGMIHRAGQLQHERGRNMRRLLYLGLALGLAGGIVLASTAQVGAQMPSTTSSSGLSGGLGSSGMGSSFGIRRSPTFTVDMGGGLVATPPVRTTGPLQDA